MVGKQQYLIMLCQTETHYQSSVIQPLYLPKLCKTGVWK